MLVFNLEERNGDGASDGIEFCKSLEYTNGNAFVVGVDREGQFKTPDLSGTSK